jgi:signal peptidase I
MQKTTRQVVVSIFFQKILLPRTVESLVFKINSEKYEHTFWVEDLILIDRFHYEKFNIRITVGA